MSSFDFYSFNLCFIAFAPATGAFYYDRVLGLWGGIRSPFHDEDMDVSQIGMNMTISLSSSPDYGGVLVSILPVPGVHSRVGAPPPHYDRVSVLSCFIFPVQDQHTDTWSPFIPDMAEFHRTSLSGVPIITRPLEVWPDFQAVIRMPLAILQIFHNAHLRSRSDKNTDNFAHSQSA